VDYFNWQHFGSIVYLQHQRKLIGFTGAVTYVLITVPSTSLSAEIRLWLPPTAGYMPVHPLPTERLLM
jgi:hypothetical protein